jgi:4'-phosphopantetheinyl transferase
VQELSARVFIAEGGWRLPWHHELLDIQERRRAASLRERADEGRFTLAAALLRLVVAEEIGCDPAEVPVDRSCSRCGGPHGKPRVLGSALEVSVSHSADLIMVAASWSGMVGVDVEKMIDIDVAELLPSVQAGEETFPVLDLKDFYTVWTRKEALLKATGHGLSRPMTTVVLGAPNEPPRVLRLGGWAGFAPALADLAVDADYAAALALLGPGRSEDQPKQEDSREPARLAVRMADKAQVKAMLSGTPVTPASVM